MEPDKLSEKVRRAAGPPKYEPRPASEPIPVEIVPYSLRNPKNFYPEKIYRIPRRIIPEHIYKLTDRTPHYAAQIIKYHYKKFLLEEKLRTEKYGTETQKLLRSSEKMVKAVPYLILPLAMIQFYTYPLTLAVHIVGAACVMNYYLPTQLDTFLIRNIYIDPRLEGEEKEESHQEFRRQLKENFQTYHKFEQITPILSGLSVFFGIRFFLWILESKKWVDPIYGNRQYENGRTYRVSSFILKHFHRTKTPLFLSPYQIVLGTTFGALDYHIRTRDTRSILENFDTIYKNI